MKAKQLPKNIAFIGNALTVSHLKKVDKWAEQQGYVYLVLFSDGLCKIGCTTYPRQRFKVISNQLSPLGIEIIRAIVTVPHVGFMITEREMHTLLRSHLVKNEFFRECEAQFIDAITKTDLKLTLPMEENQGTAEACGAILSYFHPEPRLIKNDNQLNAELDGLYDPGTLLHLLDRYSPRFPKLDEREDFLEAQVKADCRSKEGNP